MANDNPTLEVTKLRVSDKDYEIVDSKSRYIIDIIDDAATSRIPASQAGIFIPLVDSSLTTEVGVSSKVFDCTIEDFFKGAYACVECNTPIATQTKEISVSVMLIPGVTTLFIKFLNGNNASAIQIKTGTTTVPVYTKNGKSTFGGSSTIAVNEIVKFTYYKYGSSAGIFIADK